MPGPLFFNCQVVGFTGNDVADAAARVGGIARKARDEVNVEVGDGLASGFADIDSDVEAVWTVAALDFLLRRVDGCQNFGLLFRSGFEPTRDMSLGNDECVSTGNRKSIPN